MASFYLVRHGQASSGQDNYDELSLLGCKQAQTLGRHLNYLQLDIDAVVTGTMKRHQQTAGYCLEAAGLAPPIMASDNWNEYDHQQILAAHQPECATVSGMKYFLENYPKPRLAFLRILENAIIRWQSGEHDGDYSETWLQYCQRIDDGFEQLSDMLPASANALVFTSGGPIARVTQRLMNLPESKFMTVNTKLVNCGITKVFKGGKSPFIATLNEHSVFTSPKSEKMISYT